MGDKGWRDYVPRVSFGRAEQKSLHDHIATFELSPEQSAFILFGQSVGGGGNPVDAFRLYEQSSAVLIPVTYISDAFSVIDPVIKLPDGTIIKEHPVLSLLEKPSPDFTSELFMSALATNRLVTGECYIAALGSLEFPPSELTPLSPKNANPIKGDNGFVESFLMSGTTLAGTYTRSKERTGVRFTRDRLTELKQIRNFSSQQGSFIRGQSPLIGVADEIKQQILGVHHNTALLNNGGRLSLIVSFSDNMSEDDFEEAKATIRASFGGAQNAGKIAVTQGGQMDMKEMGQTNKDMDYSTLQAQARKAAASTYKFPLVLIFTDAATFNNYGTAKLSLYDDAVIPLSHEIYGGLSDFLFPRYDNSSDALPPGAKLAVDEQTVPALVDRRLDELVKRRKVNVETDNELRLGMGRERIPGGDTVRDNASRIPIGSDPFADDPELMDDPNTGHDDDDDDAAHPDDDE